MKLRRLRHRVEPLIPAAWFSWLPAVDYQGWNGAGEPPEAIQADLEASIANSLAAVRKTKDILAWLCLKPDAEKHYDPETALLRLSPIFTRTRRAG